MATAASAALPPARRISRPASVASGLAVATMWDFAVARALPPHPVAASGAPRLSWATAAIAPNATSARTASAEMVHARVVGLGFAAMVGFPGLERPSSLARFLSLGGNPVDALWEIGTELPIPRASAPHVAEIAQRSANPEICNPDHRSLGCLLGQGQPHSRDFEPSVRRCWNHGCFARVFLRSRLYVAGQSAGRRCSIPRPGGRASRGWGGDQVLVENGAAVNALFTGAGAD